MIAYLHAGRSLIMFPESTWNLTESTIMLPMKYGIIQMAQETGAQVIPTVLEYDRVHKLCTVCFGDPMVFEPSEDKLQAMIDLRDTMATMLWNHWERKGVFQRSTMDIEAERRNLKYSIQEYPPIDWEYEKSCIYHPYTEPEDVFEHLQMLSPNRENAFLLNKRFIQ